MREYLIAKCAALLLPLALIVIGAFDVFPAIPYWWFLIIVTIVTGYVHFIVGFQYQFLSLCKKTNSKKLLSIFFALIIISLLVCWGLFQNFHPTIITLASIIYFIFHGSLNERTLLERQTKITFPYLYFVGLAFSAIGIIVATISHPSFLFDGYLKFWIRDSSSQLSELVALLGFNPLFLSNICFAIGICCFLSLAYTVKKYRHTALVTLLTVLALSVLTNTHGPLPFVYLFNLFLTYHFTVWSIFQYFEIKKYHPSGIRPFLLSHLFVGVFLVSLVFILVYGTSHEFIYRAALYITSSYVFVTFSCIHVSTSLMNEPWLKKILN